MTFVKSGMPLAGSRHSVTRLSLPLPDSLEAVSEQEGAAMILPQSLPITPQGRVLDKMA